MKEFIPSFSVNDIENKKGETFEDQFADVKNLDGIETVKIKKESASEKMPIVFAPGCLRTMNTFKNSLETLSKKK
jgi:hypothetical protein